MDIKENIRRGIEALELYNDLKELLSFEDYESCIVDLFAADFIAANKITYIKREIDRFIEHNKDREFGIILPKKSDLDNIMSFILFIEEYSNRVKINTDYIMLLPYNDCSSVDISAAAAAKVSDIAWIALDTEYTNDNLRILSVHNHLSELLLEHHQSISRDNLRVLLYDTPTQYCYNKWSFATALSLINNSTRKELVDLAYLCDCSYSALGRKREEYAAATQDLTKSNNVLALECSFNYQKKDWSKRKQQLESYISYFSYKEDFKKYSLLEYNLLKENELQFELITNYFRTLNNNDYVVFEEVNKMQIELNEKAHYSHKEIRDIVQQAIEQKHNKAAFEIYSSSLKDRSYAANCYIDINYRLL